MEGGSRGGGARTEDSYDDYGGSRVNAKHPADRHRLINKKGEQCS